MEYAKPPRTDAPGQTLGATSFALLAQFAREPSSAYALASAMRRNMHYLWPRAESRIYAEVLRLQQRGLLRGVAEATGRRARTVMHVTDAGRAALMQWLATPVAGGFALESEALLRVYFATLGAPADLDRALRTVATDAAELLRIALAVGEGYLAGHGIAQEQAHVRSMIHALLGRLAVVLQEWAGECRAESVRWADLAPQGKQQAAMRRFRATQTLLAQALEAQDADRSGRVTPQARASATPARARKKAAAPRRAQAR